MASFSTHSSAIKGIAACVPKNTVFTRDYLHISMQERELFMQTTGVTERRVAPENICTSDLCFFAAEKLISELKWKREEIDLVIFVSQSPDYFLPATAIVLCERLILSKQVMAFDINLGCSGYIYGLSVAASLMQQGGFRKALLLAGDKSSLSLNPKDKTAFPLFGDAGSATALENEASEMYFNLQTDGSGKNAIIVPGGQARHKFYDGILKDTEKEYEPGVTRNICNLHLNGIDIFNFTLLEVQPNIEQLFDFSCINKEQIDFFIFHQANKLMNETIRKKLKVEKEKTPLSIHRYGNTSSASIPVTIVSELRNKISSERLRLLLSGFGVGFSWGSAIVNLNSVYCPEIIEID